MSWHKMRELAYQVHPYRWMTIGKELSHIENAKLQDVKDFFFKHYCPVNAILVVAGNVTVEQVRAGRKMVWPIEPEKNMFAILPQEPNSKRTTKTGSKSRRST